jgi:small-conductance mechanosensitive channel
VRNEKVRQFKPIISSILAILLFVLGILLVNTERGDPYWRTAYQLLSVFSWLTLAIFVSLLIRVSGSQARASRNLYIPTLLLAFMNILLRAMFLPASIVPLIFPPGLLAFIIWQSCVNVRYRRDVVRTDLRYMWTSVIVMGIACILSLSGYSMIGVFLLTFWTFELALLHTITTIYFLMKRYNESRVIRKMARYRAENPLLPLDGKEDFIEVSWIYDFLRMVVLPVTIILSFPLGVRLTSSAYQLSLTGADFLNYTFFKDPKFAYLTVENILIILALFFVFRYLIYFVKNMVRLIRLRNIIEKKRPSAVPLKRSDVNTSLSDALFSLMGWLIYLIIVFSILHITADALKTILAGLAAGVGFALKDLINNFFYGVQLMAGRIKVGDKISCDGVRGIVKRVSYQTTTVEDEDGSLIAFTNTDLFTKQFRNLNSGKNYELLKIPVSVRYGTDIARAREVILEALKPLMTKDKFGRDIVDPSFPVDVRFDSFGDSSINLIVALYSTVETHYTFPSRAKEAIYNAFHENGIDIPFHQHDIYIKTAPEDERDLKGQ